MEGSPVREPQRLPIAQLNAAHDLQTFQSAVVRLVGTGVKHGEVFFGIVEADAKHFGLPAWIKSHLDRQPGLQKRMEQGEMVGISAAEENPAPRPAAAARSSVVLIPVMLVAKLYLRKRVFRKPQLEITICPRNRAL